MAKRKIFYTRLSLVILIIINCVMIFNFSSEKGNESSSRSRNFISVFIDKDTNENEKQEIINNVEHNIRKIAHMSIYACLGGLASAYVATYNVKNKTIFKGSLIFCLIYAIGDEVHQLFVPERSGQFSDVCIDFMGAIIGTVLIVLINNIVNKKAKKNNINKKVMFISSTGGHLSELMNLSSLFNEYDSLIVTEDTQNNMYLKEKYPNRVSYMKYGTKKELFKYIYIFAYNCIKSFIILFKETPDVIVTTGTHTAVPMCYIAKILFGKKIIYIETFANIKTKTVAGKILYPISDVFVVQWEELKEKYPKAVYWGEIY